MGNVIDYSRSGDGIWQLCIDMAVEKVIAMRIKRALTKKYWRFKKDIG